ncbi:hypothetical protein DmGdi_08760 [Gluconobacter sp. Gdi]|nr:hypothetical protein DmGdi_08760 [Gluconobacter sp. Gdi]
MVTAIGFTKYYHKQNLRLLYNTVRYFFVTGLKLLP